MIHTVAGLLTDIWIEGQKRVSLQRYVCNITHGLNGSVYI